MVTGLLQVLQEVPALVSACLSHDEIPTLRCLRLVSKLVSVVVLLGLTSFKLNLAGKEGDTNVSSTKLLRNCCLENLRLVLRLTDKYSPNLLLEMFIREVGPALSTVTSLDLCIQNTGSTPAPKEELNHVVELLVSKLPLLNSLTAQGHLSVEILQQISPKLLNLTLLANRQDLPYLQGLMGLQPSLLSSVTSMTLQLSGPGKQIPDMSGCAFVLHLHLPGYIMYSTADWLCLPKNLEHLKCYDINSGPPPSVNNTPLLARLQSLDLSFNVDSLWRYVSLHAVAEILRAAPKLTNITVAEAPSLAAFRIDCDLDESTYPTISADLKEVQQRTAIDFFKAATYFVDGASRDFPIPALDVIATLPCMLGVKLCKFSLLLPGELRGLVKVFPNVRQLVLEGNPDLSMNNSELSVVAGCKCLTSMKLMDCKDVSAGALLLLCLCLPLLTSVCCERCPKLTEEVLRDCEKLLRGYNREIKMIE